MNNIIIIGKIGIAYGIYGWNKIFSYTEKKKNILKYKPWFLQEKKKITVISLEQYKIYNKGIIVKFKNINDRNKAQTFTNKKIIIKKKQLPKLNNFEYYWYDIIQCQVFNKKKIHIGNVINIIREKNNDILVIKNITYKKKEILIPFIKNIFVKNIDLNIKVIQLNI